MRSYLRYGDNSTATRLNYAQEAMRMIDPNYVPTPQADIPRGNPAAFSPEDAAYKDSFLQGGPLALFGQGQQGYNWGSALANLGAVLAAHGTPQQAAVLAKVAMLSILGAI